MFGTRNLLLFVASGILLNLTPEQETLYILGRSIAQGRRAGVLSVLGITKLAAQLQAMLTRYGFTTVIDTASLLANTLAIRRRIGTGEVAGPRILTAGLGLYPPDAIPYYVKDAVPPDLLRLLPQPSTAARATEIVRMNLDGGADIVKLFTGSWDLGSKWCRCRSRSRLRPLVRHTGGAGSSSLTHPTSPASRWHSTRESMCSRTRLTIPKGSRPNT